MSYTLIVILSISSLIDMGSGEKTLTIQNTVIDIQNIKTLQSCKREQASIQRAASLAPNVEVKFSHCSRVS